jgi:uncharacterized protein YjiS (DUF1127 family)
MTHCNDTIRYPGNLDQATAELKLRARAAGSALADLMWVVVILPVEFLRHWQSKARDRKMLRQLDDKLLKDVGLTRADLDREYSRSFFRDFPPRGY